MDSFFRQFDRENTPKYSWPEYPVNIYITDEKTIHIEVAASGVDKENISVKADDNTIKINIKGDEKDIDVVENREYLCHKLVKRGVDLEYKVGNDYDLDVTNVEVKNGILSITIPCKADAKPKQITFDIK